MTLSCVVMGNDPDVARTLIVTAQLVDAVVVVGPPVPLRAELAPRVRFVAGSTLNDGLAALADPDWIVLAEPGTLLNPRLPYYLQEQPLDRDTLYLAPRYDVGPTGALTKMAEVGSYFRLFHRSARPIHERWPNVVNAAGQLPAWEQWVVVPELGVAYLAEFSSTIR